MKLIVAFRNFVNAPKNEISVNTNRIFIVGLYLCKVRIPDDGHVKPNV
jgi:hypothetical protein